MDFYCKLFIEFHLDTILCHIQNDYIWKWWYWHVCLLWLCHFGTTQHPHPPGPFSPMRTDGFLFPFKYSFCMEPVWVRNVIKTVKLDWKFTRKLLNFLLPYILYSFGPTKIHPLDHYTLHAYTGLLTVVRHATGFTHNGNRMWMWTVRTWQLDA